MRTISASLTVEYRVDQKTERLLDSKFIPETLISLIYCYELSAVGSTFAKFQLAQQLKICSHNLHPILFTARLSSSELWLQNVVALSGRAEGRLDGVELLTSILEDAAIYSTSSISIPKQAVVKDKCKLINQFQQRIGNILCSENIAQLVNLFIFTLKLNF